MRRVASLLTACTLLVAACSGGGGGDTSPTASAPGTLPTSPLPTSVTTIPPPVTTDAPTTTVYEGPVYPLTGLPVDDPAAAARPALVVKIDNHPDARPQTGLGVADLVFEENVEGITRFAAVFQSQGSDPVGPIRSGRTQDVSLLGLLDRPLFAWSGGNANVTQAIASSDFVNLSNLNQAVAGPGGFFRSGDRKAPHNLYAQSSKLWTLAPAGAQPPPQQFAYRAEGEAPTGDPSPGVTVEMDGVRVEWQFDGTAYARLQNGRPHTDAVTGPITAANVVVLVVRYSPSPADARSPEAQTIGSGDALVFTGGSVVRGRWERSDRLQPFTLTDAAGETIALTPGRTWVELARSGSVTPG
jgi:hypothetical protein